ncbi:MAG: helix-turn-helix transcriptional regulator [Cloacibacillus sp.]
MIFKERIKEMRKTSALTQSKLAELCDVSSAHISNIESGRENPSLELLQRMAMAFDCDLYIDFIPKGTQQLYDGPQAGPEETSKTRLTFENAPARTLLAIAEAKLELEAATMTEAEKEEIRLRLEKCSATLFDA